MEEVEGRGKKEGEGRRREGRRRRGRGEGGGEEKEGKGSIIILLVWVVSFDECNLINSAITIRHIKYALTKWQTSAVLRSSLAIPLQCLIGVNRSKLQVNALVKEEGTDQEHGI